MASVLELLGIALVGAALGVWLSPWAAVAVAGAALLSYGIVLDTEPAE